MNNRRWRYTTVIGLVLLASLLPACNASPTLTLPTVATLTSPQQVQASPVAATAVPVTATSAPATTQAPIPTAALTAPPTPSASSTPTGTLTPSTLGITFIAKYDPTTQSLYIYGTTPGVTIYVGNSPIPPQPTFIPSLVPPSAAPTQGSVPPPPFPTAPPSPRATVAVATPTTQQVPAANAATLRGKLVFKTDRDGGAFPSAFQYYAMNPDGSSLQRLDFRSAEALVIQAKNPFTGTELREPGGNRIVLGERNCFGGFQSCAIYILDAQHDAALINSNDDISTGLWFQNQNYVAKSPVWSPRGNYIAFVSNHEGPPGCARTLNVFKGSPTQKPTVRRLTEFCAGGNTDAPTFSPDGARLAFWSEFPGPRKQIYVLDIGGDDSFDFRSTNPHIISDGKGNDWEPLWVK